MDLLRAFSALAAREMMWQHHFEFLLLGYGAYLTSRVRPHRAADIPDQHISQMVAGIDVVLFRADTKRAGSPALAIESEVDGAFVEEPLARRDRR